MDLPGTATPNASEGDTPLDNAVFELWRIVLPEVVKDLAIEEGEDYCTLVTCTPYRINSHRLLVRGHRIETAQSAMMRFSADAIQIDPVLVIPFLAAPILLLLFLLLMLRPNHAKNREKALEALKKTR